MFSPLLAYALILQTPDDYPATWKKISDIISTRFYDREKRGEEMNRRLKEAGEKATKATNRLQFRDTVLEMIDGFKASHFDFLTAEDQGFYMFDSMLGGKSEMPNIGAWFKRHPDGYTVQMLLNGMEAEAQGIRRGDIIVSSDGKPFTPIRSFENKSSVNLTIKRGGETLTKTVKPTAMPGLKMFLDASKSSYRVIEQGGKKIGYFRLWMMLNDDFRAAITSAITRASSNTDGFILDIRDGFGGRPEKFLDQFYLPGNKIVWNYGQMKQDQYFGYSKPLVVLINEGSRSAKEVAAQIVKTSGRGTLVGKTTAGHVLGTSPMRVNDWSILEVPMVSLKVDGIDLEGNGVKPDIEVTPEFAADGTDRILAKGIETLIGKMK